ncbi:hypothetical protein [Virgibacillus ndiopensis]|uniref:Uncharacterized protein n=1 Tax=Virgibacillus oceani TaxID=1479511 RepID=A0A917HF10_9BACI|nr:hypothetical protein [Virgibacillus ndiopensis]GGG77543.1 hypothetical protein GCM10011398_23320 [Virgibacillus oceani]
MNDVNLFFIDTHGFVQLSDSELEHFLTELSVDTVEWVSVYYEDYSNYSHTMWINKGKLQYFTVKKL